MGIEPFLVGSSLVAVLAQRLVRVLCLHCREAYTAQEHELRELGLRPTEKTVTLYRGVGCASCNHTGYYGRVGIFEMMLVDDEIRGMVSSNIDSKTIKKAAVSKGMGTLRQDGVRKALRGISSVAEVMRATEEEEAVQQI
jgi:general secretion pathway protein E